MKLLAQKCLADARAGIWSQPVGIAVQA